MFGSWILAASAMTLAATRSEPDWMLDIHPAPAVVTFDRSSGRLELSNGIVRRVVSTVHNGTTLSLKNMTTGEEFLRSLRPEATFVVDGRPVSVGGVVGLRDHAYLSPDWLPDLKPDPMSLQFVGWSEASVQKRFDWKPRSVRRREAGVTGSFPTTDADWPPRGRSLTLDFEGTGKFKGWQAKVVYELYDGLPVFMKRVSVTNGTRQTARIDSFKAEVLAVVEAESTVDFQPTWRVPNMTVTTDYTFAGMSMGASNRAVNWLPDPEYKTQVNYDLKTPCLLEVSSPVGPGTDIVPGGSFSTFRVFELLHDSTDRERKGLQVRRMHRLLAPWCLENPIMLHLTSSDPQVVRTAIDQASECGFEMVVISFWSGLDMEDLSPTNIKKWKELVDDAHRKGLELGGYSLLASRSVGPETDVIDKTTGKPGGAVFGSSPCLGSAWGQSYFQKLRTFIEQTGFDLLEHDGSYPGDVCASTAHPGHRGYEDSQWTQFATVSEFYHWCRARGVFLNVPDNYFLQGSNKTGMGYRESNWSLPREQQHVHARQNLFDGTWEKTPSMGWMMVPLVEYQGGGPAATIEPLHEHLADYERHFAANFGFGAQACYRGPRLYDTPEVKTAVVKWVSWFKEHRQILEADVVHLRRPDGRGTDYVLHVDPRGPIKAMLLSWNPTSEDVEEELTVPLRYSGLRGSATVAFEGSKPSKIAVGPEGACRIRWNVPARGMRWATFK